MDKKGFEHELLERYREVDLSQQTLLRGVEVYWRGMRRSEKKVDAADKDRESRADHVLLVLDRYLVFLEKGAGGLETVAGAPLDPAALPTLHLRPLPMIDWTTVGKEKDKDKEQEKDKDKDKDKEKKTDKEKEREKEKDSKESSMRETKCEIKKLTTLLSPIVELAAVATLMADARGIYNYNSSNCTVYCKVLLYRAKYD